MFCFGLIVVPSLLTIFSSVFPSNANVKKLWQLRKNKPCRCVSHSWCLGHEQVINFFVGLLFLPLLEQIGAQILYTVFGAFCLIAVIFVKRNVVETKGKSLQEIEMALLPVE